MRRKVIRKMCYRWSNTHTCVTFSVKRQTTESILVFGFWILEPKERHMQKKEENWTQWTENRKRRRENELWIHWRLNLFLRGKFSIYHITYASKRNGAKEKKGGTETWFLIQFWISFYLMWRYMSVLIENLVNTNLLSCA